MFLFRPKFRNHPDLIAAIGALGPAGLLDLLASPHEEPSIEPVRKAAGSIIAALTPSFAGNLSMDAIFDVFEKMLPTDSLERINYRNRMMLPPLTLEWYIVGFTRAIAILDYGDDVSAKQISSGRVDWKSLGEHVLPIMQSDPNWAAFILVDLVCSRVEVGMRVRALLDASFGRIARKECGRDIAWGKNRDFSFSKHIIDWFRSAISHDDPWLRDTDDKGRPKKLLKLGSMEALTAEADRQMMRRIAEQRKVTLGPSDETVVATSHAYRVVRLLTPRALKMEGQIMRHCIGLGAYNSALWDDSCQLLSLRSTSGRPHATLEVRDGIVVQFRGKANSDPKSEYRDAVERLMPDLQWDRPDWSSGAEENMAA